MQFPYVKCEGSHGFVYRPYLPITFSYGAKKFPVGRALVDTGSDITILPLEIAHYLEIELDDSEKLTIDCAGGGVFVAMPSQKKVTYTIEAKGFRSISWEGIIYFAENEPVVLLGHQQCLDKFDLLFEGPEKKLSITPHFKV
jgi:hypothetical protein